MKQVAIEYFQSKHGIVWWNYVCLHLQLGQGFSVVMNHEARNGTELLDIKLG